MKKISTHKPKPDPSEWVTEQGMLKGVRLSGGRSYHLFAGPLPRTGSFGACWILACTGEVVFGSLDWRNGAMARADEKYLPGPCKKCFKLYEKSQKASSQNEEVGGIGA